MGHDKARKVYYKSDQKAGDTRHMQMTEEAYVLLYAAQRNAACNEVDLAFSSDFILPEN